MNYQGSYISKIFFATVFFIAAFFTIYQNRISIAFFTWDTTHIPIFATAFAPDSAHLYFEIGDYYFNHGSYDIEKSRFYLEKSVSLQSNSLPAQYQLARLDFIQGRFLESLAGIEAVLAIDPDFTKAYYMLGLVNGYIDQLEAAEYGFQEFIKRDKTHNWAGYNDLAWIYFRQGDYVKTKNISAEGLQYNPNNPWLHNIYGVALLNLEDPEGALRALTAAQHAMEQITPEIWGRSYPGNDPSIYSQGLEEMRRTIESNIDRAKEQIIISGQKS